MPMCYPRPHRRHHPRPRRHHYQLDRRQSEYLSLQICLRVVLEYIRSNMS